MPFLRFSRDKRGVENFYLVQATTNRRGKVRPRVLYWFRSPPEIKVGRQPFDPAVRRALEAQNPDITFDWRSIIETPIPSADADKWRERRRAERAAKHAAAREDAAEDGGNAADAELAAEDEQPAAGPETEEQPVIVVSAGEQGAASASPPPGASVERSSSRKRRRRRGGAGRGPAGSASAATDASGNGAPVDASPVTPAGSDDDSGD